jgi:hypothetical protein
MKKTLFVCLMLITFNLSAKEWEPVWIAAVEDCQNEDYASAESNFTKTIHLMESENDVDHPLVYMDRARMYLSLHKYEEALTDINQAILSEKLKHWELVKAVNARVTARTKLGFTDGYEEDVAFLVKNFEVQIENTEDYLIIRNMPKEQEFRKSMINFFIQGGICHSKEDVRILSSDICVVNKIAGLGKAERNQEQPSESHCHACTFNASKQLRFDDLTIAGCVLWCDSSAFAAITGWCAFFPEFCVINACNQAVVEIQNNCRACCRTGVFSQDICAAPFADIVGAMQKFLPPCGCPR